MEITQSFINNYLNWK